MTGRTFAVGAVLMCVPPAAAQQVPERIVVTADRMPVPVSEVTAAATVLDAEQLAAAGIDGMEDLRHEVPGLVISTSGPLGQPYLRGVGSDLLSVGSESSVAVYLGGVYQPRPAAALVDLFDVERIEVVRGPQGSLYGRNATGGMIHVLPRPPGPGWEAAGSVQVGTEDLVRWQGSLNFPIGGERAQGRIALLSSRRDGYTQNLAHDERTDDENVIALRGQTRVQLSESVSALVAGDYRRDTSTRNLANLVDPASSPPALMVAGGSPPRSEREAWFDRAPRGELVFSGTSLRIDAETARGFELGSLSAWRHSSVDEALDLDGTEVPWMSNYPVEESDSFIQELILRSGRASGLHWLLGTSYLHEHAEQRLDLRSEVLNLRNVPSGRVDVDALGLFGEAGVPLSDRVRISGGLRHSIERKDFAGRQRVNGVEVGRVDDASWWRDWSPRASLEVELADELRAWALIAHGFKSGGYNSTALQPSFDPESLWSYELGLRGSWLDRRLAAGASAFLYDYDDLQVNQISSAIEAFPIIVNASRARIQGVDLDVSFHPLEGLALEASAAWLYARFREYLSIDLNDPLADPDRAGNRLPRAPQLAFQMAASYARPLGKLGRLEFRVDYAHQSRIFFNGFEDSLVSQPAYGLWGTRLRWQHPGLRWSVSVYGRNLADEVYRHSIIRDPAIGAIGFLGAPRRFGMILEFRS